MTNIEPEGSDEELFPDPDEELPPAEELDPKRRTPSHVVDPIEAADAVKMLQTYVAMAMPAIDGEIAAATIRTYLAQPSSNDPDGTAAAALQAYMSQAKFHG